MHQQAGVLARMPHATKRAGIAFTIPLFAPLHPVAEVGQVVVKFVFKKLSIFRIGQVTIDFINNNYIHSDTEYQ